MMVVIGGLIASLKRFRKMKCENSSMHWTEVKQCSRLESGDITMPIKPGPEKKELRLNWFLLTRCIIDDPRLGPTGPGT